MPDAEGGAVAPGDARLNEPINRFVAVTFRGEDPVQGGLIVNPPSLDCPPDLYVYRLDFGDGFNSSGSANLRLNDLIGLLGDNPFLEAIGSVADDYEAEFSYAFGMNGGLIAGYDTRTADLEDFFYLDTRGVLPFAQWVEGQPSDLWGFDTAQDGYDPGFAEALLRLDAGLDRLQRPDRFKLNGETLPEGWISEDSNELIFSLVEGNPLSELRVFSEGDELPSSLLLELEPVQVDRRRILAIFSTVLTVRC